MTKKDKFIQNINELINRNKESFIEQCGADFEDVMSYFADVQQSRNSAGITEQGKKVIQFMQEQYTAMNNDFTASAIAQGLFTSGRSIAGSTRKLISDGYVEKTTAENDKVHYHLTEFGKQVVFED